VTLKTGETITRTASFERDSRSARWEWWMERYFCSRFLSARRWWRKKPHLPWTLPSGLWWWGREIQRQAEAGTDELLTSNSGSHAR
jgi:hypothetical protein